MYAYDELDRTLINERVSEFRDQVKRRLSGELTEDEFKMLRLQNGVYLQLHAYMFRVAIPYGTLSSQQFARVGACRAALRSRLRPFHHPAEHPVQLDQALRIAGRAGRFGPRSASTRCRLRAITLAMSLRTNGPAWRPARSEDPRIWSELLRQYTTLHPEFSFLPRKFKFAITASDHDRAAIKVHDIGLRLHKNAAGETGLRGAGGWRARPHTLHRQDHPNRSYRGAIS